MLLLCSWVELLRRGWQLLLLVCLLLLLLLLLPLLMQMLQLQLFLAALLLKLQLLLPLWLVWLTLRLGLSLRVLLVLVLPHARRRDGGGHPTDATPQGYRGPRLPLSCLGEGCLFWPWRWGRNRR